MRTSDDRRDAEEDSTAEAPPEPDVSHLITEDSGPLLELRPEDHPDVSHLITEDGKPVDSIYVEKQYRLLTDPLETGWAGPDGKTPFVTLTNVGLFYGNRNPAIVPDFLLSVGVTYPEDLRDREHRSYFVWLFGKGPDVVGEIVSDRRGGEDTLKLRQYAELGIRYYFVYDPDDLLKGGVLRVYGLHPEGYRLLPDNKLNGLGLGLTLWQGTFANAEQQWLRWCDRKGKLLLTGAEQAAQQKRRADAARRRAAAEKTRADELAERLKRLEAQMRDAGIEPQT